MNQLINKIVKNMHYIERLNDENKRLISELEFKIKMQAMTRKRNKNER